MFNVRPSQVVARFAFGVSLALVPAAAVVAPELQAQAAATPARQSGSVKAISSSSITVVTKDNVDVVVPVAPDATVLQLAPGATNLASGQPAKISDITVGDKVIVGKPGDTATASRIILMKSGDIAARNQAEQADWAKRGTGGIVRSVTGPTFSISSGSKTVTVTTTSKTIFRRYAADSIKFQDSKAGTLDQVKAGDQLSVRGDKSEDGSSITAEEVVTGAFSNLSGVLTAVDATAGTVTFKDLTTKKPVTVKLTANSDIRQLPAQAAMMFAQRNNPAAAGGAAPGAGRPATDPSAGGLGPARGSAPGAAPGAGGPPRTGGGQSGYGGPGGPGGAGGGSARAGMDLSRMLARLPTQKVADLKTGDAVMIVASPGADAFTAITLLSGVEALLTAPAGAAPITLSPWNLGTPDAGGGPQ